MLISFKITVSHFVCCYHQQVSVLKNEKEMLVNAEKRALEEVRGLSQRVHRLQVVLSQFLWFFFTIVVYVLILFYAG